MNTKDILALATTDYQHRDGDYPESDVADTINVYQRQDNTFEIEADFKNTSEESAKYWIEHFVKQHDLTIIKPADAYQDGDYQDDWVKAWVIVKSK